MFRSSLGSQVMRAEVQRKPLGFQELTSPVYRCVSICVTRLTRSQEALSDSLVFKTKGFLEQPSNTSLFQGGFRGASVTLSNAYIVRDCFQPKAGYGGTPL